MLPKVISKKQTGFIIVRNIHTNIGLASVMMNEMETKRWGGNMALKIDIQQVYDTLERELFYECPKESGDGQYSYTMD